MAVAACRKGYMAAGPRAMGPGEHTIIKLNQQHKETRRHRNLVCGRSCSLPQGRNNGVTDAVDIALPHIEARGQPKAALRD